MPAKRIVSLIASATEICCALGLESHLVGCSHECDYPETVKRLPTLTAPKFNPDGTAYEIDQRVKAIVREGLSVYRVHADALRALEPDIIVTQSQCEVCAVSENDVLEATCNWLGTRPTIVTLCPNQLADVWQDIRCVASAAGVRDRGEELITQLQQRMTDLATRVTERRNLPQVACIEWIDPLMAAGNWMPELVTLAGGENLFGEAGKHSPMLSWDAVCAADPDVLFLSPCGHDIPRIKHDMPALTERPGWNSLKAVQSGRVYLADGNQYFNRPGPRLVESLEILAEVLHPERIAFKHHGSGWIEWRR